MNADVLQPISHDQAWGGCEILEKDPPIEVHSDVVYEPYQPGGAWGLFDRAGQGLIGGVDLLLPEGVWMDQAPRTASGPVEATQRAPDSEYVYGGRLSGDYGHFLVDTLSRYWTRENRAPGRTRILVHHPDPQAFWDGHGFAREILGAIGVGREDLLAFDRATHVERLVLPWTSFRHQTHAHRAYGRLGRRIGARLLEGRSLTPNARPVYLSKSRLQTGIRRFMGEEALEARLEAAGLEIVHPERLDLADQIALFAERPAVVGMAGSAFHNTIFAPQVGRLVLLSPWPAINANFVLFDRLTQARSRYHHVVGARPLEQAGAFRRAFQLPDPDALARAILDLL